MRKRPMIKYRDWLIERLSNNPEELAGYLEAAIESMIDDPEGVYFWGVMRNFAHALEKYSLNTGSEVSVQNFFETFRKKAEKHLSAHWDKQEAERIIERRMQMQEEE